MKIIKQGKNKYPVTAVCSACGCEFEFEKKDVKRVYDNEGMYLYVECPQCGCENDKVVPKWHQPFNDNPQDRVMVK